MILIHLFVSDEDLGDSNLMNSSKKIENLEDILWNCFDGKEDRVFAFYFRSWWFNPTLLNWSLFINYFLKIYNPCKIIKYNILLIDCVQQFWLIF